MKKIYCGAELGIAQPCLGFWRELSDSAQVSYLQLLLFRHAYGVSTHFFFRNLAGEPPMYFFI